MSDNKKLLTLDSIVEMKHHNIALLFCNFLISQKISAKVQPEGNTFVVYCDITRKDEAQVILDDFIKHPHHPKYQQAAWNNGEVAHVEADGPTIFADFKEQFFSHAGIVTLSVFVVCWVIFLLSQIGLENHIFNQISFYKQLSLELLLNDPYRIIGPAFFHFSWLHIVFNTMWWWQIGGTIERTLGRWALTNLFLVSAIVSNLGQFLVSGPNFGGLSGVVYALFGYMWWYGWLAPEKGLSISKPIVGFLLFFMLLGFADVLPVNMANMAHLLGLISGCGLAWLKIKIAK